MVDLDNYIPLDEMNTELDLEILKLKEEANRLMREKGIKKFRRKNTHLMQNKKKRK